MICISGKVVVVQSAIAVYVIFFTYEVSSTEEAKCTNARYEKCQLNYVDMSLWCDATNFTQVPHPESRRIDKQTHVHRAKIIHLNSSCVATIDPELLAHYRGLLAFNCEDNEVVEIEAKTFEKNTELQNLTLSNNRIRELSNQAFAGLYKLRILDLKSNQLTEISATVFKNLNELELLNLSMNRISAISEQAFQNLKKLKTLNLAGNSLATLSPWLLHSLSELRIINVANNHLTSINFRTFINSPHISDVDFSHNNITCIPSNLLESSKEITKFRVNDNNLRTPQPEWYENILKNGHAMTHNTLANNPWLCGCGSQSYFEFLTDDVTDDDWRTGLDIICAFPTKWEGKRLSLLGEEIFTSCTVGLTKEGKDCESSFLDPEQPQIVSFIGVAHDEDGTRQGNHPREEESTTATIKAIEVNSRFDKLIHVSSTDKQILKTEEITTLTPFGSFKLSWGIMIIAFVVATCAVAIYAVYCKRKKTNYKSIVYKAESSDESKQFSKNVRDSGYSDNFTPSRRSRTISSCSDRSGPTMSPTDGTASSTTSSAFSFNVEGNSLSSDTRPKQLYCSEKRRLRTDSGNFSNSEEGSDSRMETIHEDETDHLHHSQSSPSQYSYGTTSLMSPTPVLPSNSHPSININFYQSLPTGQACSQTKLSTRNQAGRGPSETNPRMNEFYPVT